ncbi:MAG: uroporphyrinogen-III synthase [Acidobacteria bacterium]|nr:uroporphyrinogen-III synthase [Acidobacteriota bacterium]
MVEPSIAQEQPPLKGLRVLITRPKARAAGFGEMLNAQGAEALFMPTFSIAGLKDWARVDDCLGRLEGYDWIVFTSGHGVDFFAERLRAIGCDFSTARSIAAVGPATASRVTAHGGSVALIPRRHSAEGMIDALPADLKGYRFLFLRGELARATLPDGLRSRGAVVDELTIYRTVLPTGPDTSIMDLVRSGRLDLVTFTSSSSVEGFLQCLDACQSPLENGTIQVASIGPQTSQTLRDSGMHVDIEAQVSTLPGLVEAIVHHFRKSGY